MGFFDFLFGKTDTTPKTGVSSTTFKLNGIYYRSDLEKANLPNMKVGKFCVLRRELYNKYDDHAIAVYHNGYQMGYVDMTDSKGISSMMVCNEHLLCQIERITPIEDKMPEIILRLYYRDAKGTHILPDQSGALEWVILDTSKYVGEMNDDYLPIFETFELVNRNLKWYGCSALPVGDSESLLYINEDDTYLIQFVNELNRGFIRDKADKSTFVREATETRLYGNSRILSRRIEHYLDAKKIHL